MLFAQRMKELKDDVQLNLITDVKIESGVSNNIEQSKAGSGMLGIAFASRNFYGNAQFTVINSNKNLIISDSATQIKPFANNLLIPANSGQGISNFSISFGKKSFSNYEGDWTDVSILKFNKEFFKNDVWKRLGFYSFWQLNNTQWKKDSINMPLLISSFGIFITYNVLSLNLKNTVDEKAYLSLFGGIETRRLGGDYGLSKNAEIRKAFLSTANLGWNSFTYGAKLELGKFYGKVQLSHFIDTKWQDGNLDGFSGVQATISLGAYIDLNLASVESQKKLTEMKKENKKDTELAK
jgi:hypothetical protein